MKKVLLLVDVQQGFINKQTKECYTRIEELLNTNIFDFVAATQYHNFDNSPYERFLNWKQFKDKMDYSIPEEIERKIDIIFPKVTYAPDIKHILDTLNILINDKKIQEIYLAGFDTDACVLATAFSLFDNNIRPIVLSHYCWSGGGELYHNTGLSCLERSIGKKQIIDKTVTKKSDLL